MSELQVFLTLVITHLIAVISPGPDFAVVLRNSIRYGFAATVPVALGIGNGIAVHVFYSVVGLGVIIATNPILFNSLKVAGALYLLYVAYMGWRSSSEINFSADGKDKQVSSPSFWQAYRLGFLTNSLNVKATIFFLSVYLLIAGNSPIMLQILYGVYLSSATALYFTLMAFCLGGKMRKVLQEYLPVLDKGSAILLAIMALFLLLYNQTGI